MLVVHRLGVSQSDCIVGLGGELDLPYEMVKYDRAPRAGPRGLQGPSIPCGAGPVIQDGDRSGADRPLGSSRAATCQLRRISRWMVERCRPRRSAMRGTDIFASHSWKMSFRSSKVRWL